MSENNQNDAGQEGVDPKNIDDFKLLGIDVSTIIAGIMLLSIYFGMPLFFPETSQAFYDATYGRIFKPKAIVFTKAVIFPNLKACAEDSRFNEARCKADSALAMKVHNNFRPRFTDMSNCEREHQNSCQIIFGGKADGLNFTFVSSSPKPVGWLAPQPGESDFHPQALYAYKEPGTFMTVAGAIFQGDYGSLSVPEIVTKIPDAPMLRIGDNSIIIQQR